MGAHRCSDCGDEPVSYEGELCAECLESALEEERAAGSEMPWDDYGSEEAL